MNHYEDINLQKFAVLCESVKKSYCRKPYRINKEQLLKLYEVCCFFDNVSVDHDPEEGVMEVLLEPENINGGVMAVYDLFDLHGGRLKAFQKILTYTTAVSIEPLVCEKVRISVTVPDIFVFEE